MLDISVILKGFSYSNGNKNDNRPAEPVGGSASCRIFLGPRGRCKRSHCYKCIRWACRLYSEVQTCLSKLPSTKLIVINRQIFLSTDCNYNNMSFSVVFHWFYWSYFILTFEIWMIKTTILFFSIKTFKIAPPGLRTSRAGNILLLLINTYCKVTYFRRN